MIKISEMAYSRPDAISRCANLGKQFINHFNKIMASGGINDPDFLHHCVEMYHWLNDVRKIVLKHSSKCLNTEQLMDWFLPLVVQ